MAKTYEAIGSVTLLSNTTDVSFANIPSTYTDLVISGQATYSAVGTGQILLYFNTGTGSNHSTTTLYANGTSALSTRTSNYAFSVLANTLRQNELTNFNVDIMSYSNTNIFTTILSSSANANSTGWVDRGVSLWRDTSIINKIVIVAGSPGFAAGSKFTLYGIKAYSPVTPLLTASTSTLSSVSATISNYDASLTYTLSSTAGTPTRSTNTVTVSGLNPDQNITLTVTATDGNNSSSSNIISLTAGPVATGGTTTVSGGYRIHTFTSSDTFTLNATKNIEYLIIAGGAGGGNSGVNYGAGGGAGGYRSNVPGQVSGGGASAETTMSVSAGSYTVTVGGGGGVTSNGSNSSFNSIISTGGGRGGVDSIYAGADGGSGGGGVGGYAGGNGTSGQGYAGGASSNFAACGGGAASAGGGSTAGSTGGNGASSNITGTSIVRAGGGGGVDGASGLAGGNGGGGAGAYSGNGVSGTANTGGGGGGMRAGGSPARVAGAGGSGIVIIRYLL